LRPVRTRFGFVFQDPATSLNPRLRVGDCVAEPLRVHKIMRGAKLAARVDELLDAVRPPTDTVSRYPMSCPAASGSARTWRGRWRCAPTCWSATSPPARSTCRCRRRCSTCSSCRRWARGIKSCVTRRPSTPNGSSPRCRYPIPKSSAAGGRPAPGCSTESPGGVGNLPGHRAHPPLRARGDDRRHAAVR
jgi:hypothetical protein